MVKTIAFIPVIFSCLIAEESLPLSCGELLLSNKNTFQYVYRGDTVDLTDLDASICYIVEMSPISVIQYRITIEVDNGWVSEPVTHNDTSSIIEAKASTSISYGIDSDNELEEITIECALTAYKPIYPRIVYQAVIDFISRRIEEPPVECVYSYRLNSDRRTSNMFKFWRPSWLRMRKKMREMYANGYCCLLRSDIAAYFEHIDHHILRTNILNSQVKETKVLDLLKGNWGQIFTIHKSKSVKVGRSGC